MPLFTWSSVQMLVFIIGTPLGLIHSRLFYPPMLIVTFNIPKKITTSEFVERSFRT